MSVCVRARNAYRGEERGRGVPAPRALWGPHACSGGVRGRAQGCEPRAPRGACGGGGGEEGRARSPCARPRSMCEARRGGTHLGEREDRGRRARRVGCGGHA